MKRGKNNENKRDGNPHGCELRAERKMGTENNRNSYYIIIHNKTRISRNKETN